MSDSFKLAMKLAGSLFRGLAGANGGNDFIYVVMQSKDPKM